VIKSHLILKSQRISKIVLSADRGCISNSKVEANIPILRFGPNNNFAKFKEALANKALHEYGDLGRLIELGEYYVPEPPDVTDYDLMNDPFGRNRSDRRVWQR
jgi:hypothetical protein